MTSAIETALTELSANLRRMEQRHQAVGCKFDRLYGLIDAAREELAGLRPIPDDMGYRSIQKDGPVGMSLQWLDAALKCESFVWDGDQRECAEQSLQDARTWMGQIGPVPESQEPDSE